MLARGWEELDVLLVTGDAYVDHPAFGPILIARFLEGRGFRVGVVAQPRWDCPDDIARMGTPRLFVGISAGNLDSMLNKLTAQKKVRGEDQYSPNGAIDKRPNRASIAYSNLSRQAFPRTPIVLGGIEASLRRIAHYDYWSDQVRRSILLDAKADLLVFGMGERPAWEIAKRLERGQHVDQLTDIRGTAHVKKNRRAVGAAPRQAEQVRHRREAARAPQLRRGDGRQEGVRADEPAVPVRDQPAQRPPDAPGARRGGGLLQLARRAARRVGHGRPVRPAVHAPPAPQLRRRAHPRVRDGEALDRDHARLLRRLHLLQHHRARRARHPVTQRRERPARSARALAHGRASGGPSAISVARRPTCTR